MPHVAPPPSLDPNEREALVSKLMNAFVLHGMSEHIQLLKSYAAAGKRGQAGTGVYWSDAYAKRWAAMFQLPPYDQLLPVKTAESSCERCPATATHRSGRFPGGCVVRCDGCSLEWLVVDGRP